MTSKIKVDNINKVSDDSTIIKKCGSTTTVGSGAGNTIVVCGATVTIGRCGGTVALASGATQSGFGRSGSVNWQTSIKTANFTAVSGEGYFCDTNGGAFTLTLPSSPSAGDIVALKDYKGTFDSEALTIGRNGSNLNGNAEDSVQNVKHTSLTLVYADSTQGWLAVEEGTGNIGFVGISATGGTATTSGNCKIHTFTGPGTFTVNSVAASSSNNILSYMVVGGGGGGGRYSAAGGGAGGFREYKSPATPYTASPLNGNPGGTEITATVTSFPVTIGAGGATHPSPNPGGSGSNGTSSVFSTVTSAGGGYGSGGNGTANPGGPGGSGGGSGGTSDGGSAGSGNTPPVSPPQGNNGGVRAGQYGAGGGGAGAVGGNSGGPLGFGVGGDGVGTGINPSPGIGSPGPCGSLRYFSGGGGATGVPGNNSPTSWGAGGNVCGGTGKAGVVVIRYRFQ